MAINRLLVLALIGSLILSAGLGIVLVTEAITVLTDSDPTPSVPRGETVSAEPQPIPDTNLTPPQEYTTTLKSVPPLLCVWS